MSVTVGKWQNDRPHRKKKEIDRLYLTFETIIRFLENTNITYSKLHSQGFILQGQHIICFPVCSLCNYVAKRQT